MSTYSAHDNHNNRITRILSCFSNVDDCLQKGGEENDLEKGGPGSGRHKSDSSRYSDTEFKTLIWNRIKNPEDEEAHNKVKEYLEEHFGKISAHGFSEAFDPRSHGLERARAMVRQMQARPGHDDIEKGGEGSRGGKVIGHTRSGKPVYDVSHRGFVEVNHSNKKSFKANYEHFTPEDHQDAIGLHKKEHELAKDRFREDAEKHFNRKFKKPDKSSRREGYGIENSSFDKEEYDEMSKKHGSHWEKEVPNYKEHSSKILAHNHVQYDHSSRMKAKQKLIDRVKRFQE